jgi:hypothetical protein
LRLADEITIRPAADRHALPCSELVVAGRPTGLCVAGKVLEAAVEIDGRYLLFLTEGVTMEERLSIHLVSAQARLLDTASVGLMVALGLFARLKLAPPHEVRFRFLGDAQWCVEVHPEPRWAWPFAGEAPGVRRPFGWRRSFRLQATPES